MLRVEKPLTDLNLVQGNKKTQGQGAPLSNQAQTEESNLFQSELQDILGQQTEQNTLNPELEAVMDSVEQTVLPINSKEAKKIAPELLEAMKQEVAIQPELNSKENEKLNIHQKSLLPIIIGGQREVEGESDINNLKTDLKSGVNELEELLSKNSDKVQVKVTELTDPITAKENSVIGKMKSPWSLENILGEDAYKSREELVIKEYGTQKAKDNQALEVQKDLNNLDKNLIAEVSNSNARILKNGSLNKFNSFKQNSPFESALVNDSVNLQIKGPQVFEGEKFESIHEIQKHNLMNIGMPATTLTAGQKLAQNVTLKSLDKAEGTNINEISQKIMDYIRQNSSINNGNVEVKFNHDVLGEITLKVNEAEKGIININLQSANKQGMDFFKNNKSEIVEVLTKSGIQVADFSVSQSSSDSKGSWNFNGNSQNNQNSERHHQQNQDSQRRKQLWQNYQEQEAA